MRRMAERSLDLLPPTHATSTRVPCHLGARATPWGAFHAQNAGLSHTGNRMARTYQRKTDTDPRAVAAQKELQKAWDAYARPTGWPKGFIPAVTFDDTFQESFTRLSMWLNRLRNQPLAFSALLQVWLDARNIQYPRRVFKEG